VVVGAGLDRGDSASRAGPLGPRASAATMPRPSAIHRPRAPVFRLQRRRPAGRARRWGRPVAARVGS
jgi:hypothetical protein